MGRKSKRMALYEAIRQGQAKIAQGLENGQMRSDGIGQQNAQKQNVQKSASRQRLVAKSALFESKEPSQGILSSPKRVMIAMGSGAVLLMVLAIWLLTLLFGGSESVEPTGPTGQPVEQTQAVEPENPVSAAKEPEKVVAEKKDTKSGFFNFGKKETKDAGKAETTKTEVPIESSVGKNVIAIQGISASRKDELVPLREFFVSKGIATEIIINRNGYAVLVSQQGFVENPAGEGTKGNRLMKRIRQLGLAYPEETGDTKWGIRPFQEAYGYKR